MALIVLDLYQEICEWYDNILTTELHRIIDCNYANDLSHLFHFVITATNPMFVFCFCEDPPQ